MRPFLLVLKVDFPWCVDFSFHLILIMLLRVAVVYALLALVNCIVDMINQQLLMCFTSHSLSLSLSPSLSVSLSHSLSLSFSQLLRQSRDWQGSCATTRPLTNAAPIGGPRRLGTTSPLSCGSRSYWRRTTSSHASRSDGDVSHAS